MTTADNDSIRAAFEGFQNKQCVDAADTWESDYPDVVCHGNPADSCQIRADIRAPVAHKRHYLRFKPHV
jgi:hypothetical protein